MRTELVLVIFFLFLLSAVGLILRMFVSLAKQEDERRKMIVEKASATTFAIVVLYLLLCVGERVWLIVSGRELAPQGINPFVLLTVTAVLYAVQLFRYRRKYGD